jgi:hypothetical protein
LLNFVVLQRNALFAPVPIGVQLAAAAALLWVIIAKHSSNLFRVNYVVRVFQGIAAAFVAATVAAPMVSEYRIVLAPRTFALLCLVVLADRVAPLAQKVGSVVTHSKRSAIATTVLIAGCFFASLTLQVLTQYKGNYSGFLHMSERVARAAPLITERPDLVRTLITQPEGYDGEFMYLMAFDPFISRYSSRPALYAAVIDDPPYRFGRIGFSALTHFMSVGPELYPTTMVWLTVVAHLALAGALALLATDNGLSPFAALAYLLVPGFVVSTLFSLPEGIAAAATVGGFLAWRRNLLWASAVFFAATLLIRETGVLLLLCLVGSELGRRRWIAAMVLCGATIPVLVWRLYVAFIFQSVHGVHALLTNPGDFTVPLVGLGQLFLAGLRRSQPAPEIAGALAFPIILVTLVAYAAWALCRERGPVQFAAVGYGLVAISLNYEKVWSHLPSGERGTFEVFLCIVILGLSGSAYSNAFKRLTTLVAIVVGCYTLVISPEAWATRQALLLIR